MIRIRLSWTVGFLLLGTAAGCRLGPEYARPSVPTPTQWKETHVATNTLVWPEQWWEICRDADLSALEMRAVKANQDLRRAAARVAEARAFARESAADLYPMIGAGAGYSRERLSENRNGAPNRGFEGDDFQASFDLNYELDVWGRVRRSVEAAKAESKSVEADLQVVLLTLTADVARSYYLIRSLDDEAAIVQSTIALRRDAMQLQATRRQAGLINEVDLTRARTELANVEADWHALRRSRAQVEHGLAVLCGEPPASFALPPSNGWNDLAPVPAGLPASILQRRPDVAAAELIVQGASARIGVAEAAFFPTIKLTGAAGLASADLGTLVNWPSRVFSAGPSVHFPIFEGGRNRENLRAAQAQYEQAVASYRMTVLTAFREVEDALSDLGSLTSQGEAVRRAVDSARETAVLAAERYEQGLSNYLDVVDAQRSALQAQRQESQLRGLRAVSTIFLAKALGGGWNMERGLSRKE